MVSAGATKYTVNFDLEHELCESQSDAWGVRSVPQGKGRGEQAVETKRGLQLLESASRKRVGIKRSMDKITHVFRIESGILDTLCITFFIPTRFRDTQTPKIAKNGKFHTWRWRTHFDGRS